MVHHVADGLIHLLPQVQRHALLALGALIDRIVQAGDRRDTALHGPQDGPHRAVLRVPGQVVAALGAPH